MPWAQPATGFTGQLMTDEVARSWCPQSRALLPACLVADTGWSGGLGTERCGDAVVPAPGREEGRAHHASSLVWGGHC